ncbi:hypothetical protein NDU88_006610 [Pleurodeles waltl]|uniref:Uncharacterized protein n=1 Tax=Pleurodeles waltl TaxID=8319 RepID=A0AAV7QP24_PLEWA|nr:hypothetical protein NDU88_006610 [Pleurodeles waltl]
MRGPLQGTGGCRVQGSWNSGGRAAVHLNVAGSPHLRAAVLEHLARSSQRALNVGSPDQSTREGWGEVISQGSAAAVFVALLQPVWPAEREPGPARLSRMVP